MRREDLEDVLNRLPISEHARLHLIMRAGPNISIDTVIRLEPVYVVLRGREAGNQDEGRAFFVPYEEICFIKMERVIAGSEIEAWFSDTSPMTRAADSTLAQTPPPAQETEVLNPNEIARQNLLKRLRDARSVIRK